MARRSHSLQPLWSACQKVARFCGEEQKPSGGRFNNRRLTLKQEAYQVVASLFLLLKKQTYLIGM